MACKGETEDESADDEEKLHAPIAIMDKRAERLSHDPAVRLVKHLDGNMEKHDGKNCDKTQSINLGNIGTARSLSSKGEQVKRSVESQASSKSHCSKIPHDKFLLD